MNRSIIEISDFRRDSEFYGRINLLLTIKSYDLQAIRRRYIASLNNSGGRAGSVERRDVALGGVVGIQIKGGKIVEEKQLCKLKEPRGIDLQQGHLAISSENRVYVLHESEINCIENDWFSYIHTVKYNRDNVNRILISSSGFDAFFEYDLTDHSPCFEWFAWEHGINKGIEPESGEELLLTRRAQEAEEFKKVNANYLFIENPLRDALPTAKRAAFINSVDYDVAKSGSVLATFFHHGAINRIDLKSGKAVQIIGDLLKPHGGCNFKSGYMATSTSAGLIVVEQDNKAVSYSLRGLEGKPEELANQEWVQNSVVVDNLIIAIDSNRTSFVIFDIEHAIYDIVPYHGDWAVQDAVVGVISAKQADSLNTVSE